MNVSPFRTCNYCGAEDDPSKQKRGKQRRAWTLFSHSRKLACPSCTSKGSEENERTLVVLNRYRTLLEYRLLAEPGGDGPQRRGDAEGECLGSDGDADGADGRRCALATAREECLGSDAAPTMFTENGQMQGRVLRQYGRIKGEYPDAVLMFRVGDHYYLLEGDAEVSAAVLGLTTGLIWCGEDMVRLASFPFSALDSYLPMVVKAGYRVAICDQMEGPPVPGMVCEPVEEYRRIKPLYKDALLVLRDHQGYLMLYRDAQRAAEVLQVGYNGTGAFRIAKSMLETVLDQLVKAGHRVAVVIDPHVDDPRMARQTDLWDALATDATMVEEPVVQFIGAYEFPSRTEIRFCLLERPLGTVVEVQVNWLGWAHTEVGRLVHLDLRGGRASSETGYRSHFMTMSATEPLTEAKVVEAALDYCTCRSRELRPGVDAAQQFLF